MFEHATAQYRDLLKMNFPVAKILNIDTAEKDGFFLVERISHPFTIEQDVDLGNLESNHPLNQAKRLFEIGVRTGLALDLSE